MGWGRGGQWWDCWEQLPLVPHCLVQHHGCVPQPPGGSECLTSLQQTSSGQKELWPEDPGASQIPINGEEKGPAWQGSEQGGGGQGAPSDHRKRQKVRWGPQTDTRLEPKIVGMKTEQTLWAWTLSHSPAKGPSFSLVAHVCFPLFPILFYHFLSLLSPWD